MGIPFQWLGHLAPACWRNFRRYRADRHGGSFPSASSWVLPDCLSGITEEWSSTRCSCCRPGCAQATSRASLACTRSGPHRAVITKLDETIEAGGVMQPALPSNIPIAYLCKASRSRDIREASWKQ